MQIFGRTAEILGAQLKILGAQLIMLGASISKEKVKTFYVLKHCYVYMSSSVCYFYFSPARTDKTQPIYHAVIPL